MSTTATDRGPTATTVRWLRGLWEYYRAYTHTAIHAVATAALTGIGLLVFVDPLFALLAIASYCFPPIALYVLDADVGQPPQSTAEPTAGANRESRTGGAGSGGDTDSDSGDGDTDSDSDDGDTDSDSDDGDTDSDSDDGDTDSDG